MMNSQDIFCCKFSQNELTCAQSNSAKGRIDDLSPFAAANGLVRSDILGPTRIISQTASRSVQPFCTIHPRDQHTDTLTTLRVTSVAIGRINITHTMQPKT